MSGSLHPDRPALPAAALPVEPPDGGDVSADIQAEIADHLASAAAAMELTGTNPNSAKQQAVARFGDVQKIARKCWWVQQGDQVMRRTLWVIGGVAALAIVASFILPATAKLHQLRDSVDLLTEELAALRQSQQEQQALLARKPPRYEISGRTYLGDATKPAGRVAIDVWNVDAGKVVRRVTSDAQGRFTSGLLPPGVYSVVAPLVGPGNFEVEVQDRVERQPGNATESRMAPFYAVQSEPVYIGDGIAPAELLLDVRLPQGEVSFLTGHLVKDLPKSFDLAEFKDAVTLRVRFSVKPLSLDFVPYHVHASPPARWPATGFRGGWIRDLVLSAADLAGQREVRFARFWVPDITPGKTGQRDAYTSKSSSFSRPAIPSNAGWVTFTQTILLPGEYQVGVALVPEFEKEAITSPTDQERIKFNHSFAVSSGVQTGEIPPEMLLTVRVEDGRRSQVRIVVPAELSKLLDEMRAELGRPVASPPGPSDGRGSEKRNQFEAWANAFRPRPLKVELAGSTTATGL